MTWMYLPNSLFSLDTEESHSDSDSRASQSEQSATSSENTTSRDSSSDESRMEYWTTHRFGVTRRLTTGTLGVERWISSLRASLASLTVLPDGERVELTTAISGRIPSESYLRFDPLMCSWRTPGFNFGIEASQHMLTPSLLTLHPSGMTRSGRMYQLAPLVPHTSVGDGGVLPTPKDAPDDGGPPNLKMNTKRWGGVNSLGQMATKGLWPTPKARDAENGESPAEEHRNSPDLAWIARKFPTPTAADSDRTSLTYPSGNPTLRGSLMPTPTVMGNRNRSEYSSKAGDGLETYAQKFPTPIYSDAEEAGTNHIQLWRTVRSSPHGMSSGKLCPEFVEWLMGLPKGWTSLDPIDPDDLMNWIDGMFNRTAWDGEWPGVSRVTHVTKDRVPRLRALGNGVVPAVVRRFLVSHPPH